MKPMLCHRYEAHHKRLVFPCYIQPKLNGIRLLATNSILQTRSYGKESAKTFGPERLTHIRNALSSLPSNFILDGELYYHGFSLQQINGAASVNSETDRPQSHNLQYHIFDCIIKNDLSLSFTERFSRLRALYRAVLSQHSPTLSLVDTHLIASPAEGDSLYLAFKSSGYEGAIYRLASSPYGLAEHCTNKENRWSCILKRKDWLDDIATIIDITEGTGKYVGAVGALVCSFDNVTFSIGSGMSDSERFSWFSSPPIGRQVKFTYETLSDSGIPLKPTFEHLIDI